MDILILHILYVEMGGFMVLPLWVRYILKIKYALNWILINVCVHLCLLF